MSAAFQFLPALQQRQSRDPAGLTDIFDPAVNLVIWQREPDPMVAAYSEFLAASATHLAFSQLQTVAEPAQLAELLSLRLPDAAGKTEFIADLQLLSEMLTCLMDCPAVGFRLKRLQQAMCPRFHTDHVALRLLVTYYGSGTEWLPAGPDAEPRRQPQLPQQLQPSAVALLKGSAWQGNAQGAIWHRSPASNTPRLLLSLDPVGE